MAGTSGSGGGRRRLRGQARREQLLEVAARLFAERGYARTTTREIARAAGVSEGAIYRHFPSKRELLLSFVRSAVVDSAGSLLSGLEEASAEEWIRAFLSDRFALAGRSRALIKVVIGEALFDEGFAAEYVRTVFEPLVRLLEQQIERWVASGAFRPVDVPLAARSLIGMAFSWALWQSLNRPPGRAPGREVVEQLAGIFLYGVSERGGGGSRPARGG